VLLLSAAAASALTGCTGGSPSGEQESALPSPTVTAAPMRPNQIVALTGTVPAIKAVPDAAKALVIGVDGRLQLTGTASPQVVTTDDGDKRAAPGQRLLVVQFHPEGGFQPNTHSGQSSVSTPTDSVALVVDGTRTVLEPQLLNPGDDTIAASIPKDAQDVSLEVDTGALKQTLSLVSGARTGAEPTVLYRSDAQDHDGLTYVSTNMDQRLSFPFALYDNSGELQWPDGQYPTIIDVQKADLSYTVTKPNKELLYPSAPDKALLTLETQVTGGNTWYTALDPKSFVLSTPDGQQITAKRIDDPTLGQGHLQNGGNQFFGGKIYWEVPAELKSATVIITADKNHNMSGMFDSYMLDYHNAAKSFPIRF
jgi:hypothetical protein